eukprot:scaffold676_cov273-Pinguiococcus_pyrenoidosus.AAC.1
MDAFPSPNPLLGRVIKGSTYRNSYPSTTPRFRHVSRAWRSLYSLPAQRQTPHCPPVFPFGHEDFLPPLAAVCRGHFGVDCGARRQGMRRYCGVPHFQSVSNALNAAVSAAVCMHVLDEVENSLPDDQKRKKTKQLQALEDYCAQKEIGQKQKKIVEKGETDYSKLRVKQLKSILADRGVECVGCLEKSDYVKRCQDTEHMDFCALVVIVVGAEEILHLLPLRAFPVLVDFLYCAPIALLIPHGFDAATDTDRASELLLHVALLLLLELLLLRASLAHDALSLGAHGARQHAYLRLLVRHVSLLIDHDMLLLALSVALARELVKVVGRLVHVVAIHAVDHRRERQLRPRRVRHKRLHLESQALSIGDVQNLI